MTSELNGLHAIAYARVSTDDKGQDVNIQITAITKWAGTYGVILDAIYSEDVSGAKWPRDELMKAILQVRYSSAAMLVCYDESRLTRDAEHQMPIIKDLLNGKVIRYVVHGDSDPESFGMRVMSAVKGVADSEERRKLRERTKLALEQKRDVQHIHVGRPARIIICDSTDGFNKGLIGEKTIVLKPSKVLGFAREGWPPCYVAIQLLNIPPATFIRALDRAELKQRYYEVLKAADGVKDGN